MVTACWNSATPSTWKSPPTEPDAAKLKSPRTPSIPPTPRAPSIAACRGTGAGMARRAAVSPMSSLLSSCTSPTRCDLAETFRALPVICCATTRLSRMYNEPDTWCTAPAAPSTVSEPVTYAASASSKLCAEPDAWLM